MATNLFRNDVTFLLLKMKHFPHLNLIFGCLFQLEKNLRVLRNKLSLCEHACACVRKPKDNLSRHSLGLCTLGF